MSKKIKVMYLACKHLDIIGVKRRTRIRQLFCRHKHTVKGDHCSAHGLRRINGVDTYTVCMDCGKIINEQHTDWR